MISKNASKSNQSNDQLSSTGAPVSTPTNLPGNQNGNTNTSAQNTHPEFVGPHSAFINIVGRPYISDVKTGSQDQINSESSEDSEDSEIECSANNSSEYTLQEVESRSAKRSCLDTSVSQQVKVDRLTTQEMQQKIDIQSSELSNLLENIKFLKEESSKVRLRVVCTSKETERILSERHQLREQLTKLQKSMDYTSIEHEKWVNEHNQKVCDLRKQSHQLQDPHNLLVTASENFKEEFLRVTPAIYYRRAHISYLETIFVRENQNARLSDKVQWLENAKKSEKAQKLQIHENTTRYIENESVPLRNTIQQIQKEIVQLGDKGHSVDDLPRLLNDRSLILKEMKQYEKTCARLSNKLNQLRKVIVSWDRSTSEILHRN